MACLPGTVLTTTLKVSVSDQWRPESCKVRRVITSFPPVAVGGIKLHWM
jgi:hypothetical protein